MLGKATALAAVAAVALAQGASADRGRSPLSGRATAGVGFIEEFDASDLIENRGFSYGGRHKNVDTAFCIGLKYAPYRRGTYGLNRYSQLKCSSNAADGHFYSMRFVMVASSTYQLRRIHRDF